ncbi:MAG TPA: helix-turn-helix domain-containing protein [Candidatus Eisenbacteria bacterium]|jgi:AraC-like DNA-binding protein|nr:helix-turn-helix domain-containing protein [Candidatus Eisenbacteria bacterium]
MAYHERSPNPLLVSAIESVWSFSDDSGSFADQSHCVFPDGCIELIVHRGLPFRWKREGAPARSQPDAFVVGQLSEPMWLIPGAAFDVVGIRFRPGAGIEALGGDLGVLSNGVVPLEALWGKAARHLVNAVREAATPARAQRILEAAVLEHLGKESGLHPATRRVIDAILRARGQVRIDRLARDVGWTERHLERRFLREVGLLPKTFARTVRFQHLLQVLSALREDDWAGIAWECGFSDQAHLIREFRRFTGATPARLGEETLAVARQFISPERLERYFSDPPAGHA